MAFVKGPFAVLGVTVEDLLSGPLFVKGPFAVLGVTVEDLLSGLCCTGPRTASQWPVKKITWLAVSLAWFLILYISLVLFSCLCLWLSKAINDFQFLHTKSPHPHPFIVYHDFFSFFFFFFFF